MWRKCAVMAPAVAAVSAVGVAPVGGQANGQGDALHGDLNGDGITDEAILSSLEPGLCGVTVRPGVPWGGFGPATTYTYPRPGTEFPECPDMGVIVDLGGDGVSELVLAWFNGRPGGVNDDLLVLRDFVPVDGFTAIFQPSEIGLADFNGDGLQDVYEWTDQGSGIRTFLNTPSSELVPGPVRVCTDIFPNFELADFDGDGAMDIVSAYVLGCPEWGLSSNEGVVVVLDDGTVVPLLDQDDGGDWSVDAVDVNGDGNIDVVATPLEGEARVFLGNGDGTFHPK